MKKKKKTKGRNYIASFRKEEKQRRGRSRIWALQASKKKKKTISHLSLASLDCNQPVSTESNLTLPIWVCYSHRKALARLKTVTERDPKPSFPFSLEIPFLYSFPIRDSTVVTFLHQQRQDSAPGAGSCYLPRQDSVPGAWACNISSNFVHLPLVACFFACAYFPKHSCRGLRKGWIIFLYPRWQLLCLGRKNSGPST